MAKQVPPLAQPSSRKNKVDSADAAVRRIRDGDNVTMEREALPPAERFRCDAAGGRFFVNFEGLTVRRLDDVAAIRTFVERHLAPLGRAVPAIVPHDNVTRLPDVFDACVATVGDRVARFYSRVTRHTTSSFLRAELGPALASRAAHPRAPRGSQRAPGRAHGRRGLKRDAPRREDGSHGVAAQPGSPGLPGGAQCHAWLSRAPAATRRL